METILPVDDEPKELSSHVTGTYGYHGVANPLPLLLDQINNPLGTISSQAKTGRDIFNGYSKFKEIFESIMNAVDEIEAIKKEIMKLRFSEAEEMAGARLNLVDVIEESLEMFNSLMRFKGVVVERHFEDDAIYVRGFRHSLGQGLKNLILNGIDEMEGAELKVLTMRVAKNRAETSALIEIEHKGSGVSEEKCHSVWQPCLTAEGKGRGLGFAIAKEAVALHQGSIEARNRTDGGVCFVIELPCDNYFEQTGSPCSCRN